MIGVMATWISLAVGLLALGGALGSVMLTQRNANHRDTQQRLAESYLTGLRPSPTRRVVVGLGEGAPVGWVRP